MQRVEEHARDRVGDRTNDARRRRGPGAGREMTAEERRQFALGARRWRDMDVRERSAMKRRLSRFQALDDRQQRELIERAFPHATEHERARALERLRAARPHARPRD